MIGPAEIADMMAEYADALAERTGERPAGTPVWPEAAGEPTMAAAPYESLGPVPLAFWSPFADRQPG